MIEPSDLSLVSAKYFLPKNGALALDSVAKAISRNNKLYTARNIFNLLYTPTSETWNTNKFEIFSADSNLDFSANGCYDWEPLTGVTVIPFTNIINGLSTTAN